MWAILNVNLALLFYLLFVVGFHEMEFNFSRREMRRQLQQVPDEKRVPR